MSEGGGPTVRREQVRRRVLDEGYARVDDLVREFDVSMMTVHRDLDALEAEGWLTKIRGGATANPSALVDAGVRERTSAMAAEKQAIADLAAEMLQTGQTVFLDDSTTGMCLVDHLVAHRPLTVVTNFVPAVLALGGQVETHLLGGEYNARQEACQGMQTADAVGQFRADLVFMSTTALSDGVLLHRSEPTVLVRKAFLRHARRRVLMVDHAKFGRPAPHVLTGVESFDVVITDDGVDPADLALVRERCADVRIATLR